MTAKQRWDSYPVRASVDSNGFLVDTPVVARIGLQTYYLPDGTARREFRPASEVFSADSMSTYVGKPITVGHVTVTSENAKDVAVGSTTGTPFRFWGDSPDLEEGTGLACPLTVFDKSAVAKAMSRQAAELSVGYTSVDIDKPGWGNERTGEYFFDEDENATQKADELDQSEGWVRFDAVQTTIRVNHIALVFRGRAGVAKLNLDSVQDFPYDDPEPEQNKEDSFMTVKIKIDSAEHEVPQAVADHINTLSASATQALVKADAAEAQIKTLQEKVDGIPSLLEAEREKVKADAKEMADLVKLAVEVGVKTDGLDAKGIKIEFVKAKTGMDVAQKDDAYIDVAFDMAKNSDTMAAQRAATTTASGKNDSDVEPVPTNANRFKR